MRPTPRSVIHKYTQTHSLQFVTNIGQTVTAAQRSRADSTYDRRLSFCNVTVNVSGNYKAVAVYCVLHIETAAGPTTITTVIASKCRKRGCCDWQMINNSTSSVGLHPHDAALPVHFIIPLLSCSSSPLLVRIEPRDPAALAADRRCYFTLQKSANRSGGSELSSDDGQR